MFIPATRIDALLLTHWGIDNILSLSGVMTALQSTDSSDSLTCLLTPPPLGNPTISGKLAPVLPEEAANSSLVVSLPAQVGRLLSELKSPGRQHVCLEELTRGAKFQATARPIPLYHKVNFYVSILYFLL
ncbi:unnamed protein product [Protopolystoma xenopodis]|uniref:Uncharacterized protein n=1 Tax=Protopolystoma xenopodis TaxID=117903 RepID=A0A3S5AP34_9PLAT|nr:unnamed protein product [Protopolystoma xenopodis]